MLKVVDHLGDGRFRATASSLLEGMLSVRARGLSQGVIEQPLLQLFVDLKDGLEDSDRPPGLSVCVVLFVRFRDEGNSAYAPGGGYVG